MSVQYKSADGWKNISSSSNNAVDTVENGNMNPVTSNAVWEQSHYENAVRLNFQTNDDGTGGILIDTTTYDTADKQIEYVMNYIRNIAINSNRQVTYCGYIGTRNASNTTSVAYPTQYNYIIISNIGASGWWARGSFFIDDFFGYDNNAIAGISQSGSFWVRRQCERSVDSVIVAENVTITADAPTSTYTADRDGEVFVHITNQTGGHTPNLVVNGAGVDSCGFYDKGACTLRARVSKGDTYQVRTDTPAGSTYMRILRMGIQGIVHWTDRATSW